MIPTSRRNIEVALIAVGVLVVVIVSDPVAAALGIERWLACLGLYSIWVVTAVFAARALSRDDGSGL